MNHGIQLPPQNIAAERATLSAVMLGNANFSTVENIIGAADFYVDLHAEMWLAMCDLVAAEQPCDPVTMAHALDSRGTLEEIGGMAYLNEIHETLPDGGLHRAVYYAGIVAECAKRRKAINIGRKLIEDAYRGSEDAVEFATAAATKLAESLPTKRRELRPLSEHVSELIDNMDAGIKPTRFDLIPEIDAQIGGSCDGEVVLIAAATSHGKTLMALQMLDCASIKGTAGGILSEEMSALSLASRSLAGFTSIRNEQWLENSHHLRIESRGYFAGRAPVIIAEKCFSIGRAEAEIARMVKQHGVKLVAVDYAQLIRGEGGNRVEKLADVSGRIKHAATKHEIRILLMAGLNRQISLRDDPEPEMSDIEGTTAFAKDADVVLMPYYPFADDKSFADPMEFRIFHRKGRSRGIHLPMLLMSIDRERQRLVQYTRPVPGGF